MQKYKQKILKKHNKIKNYSDVILTLVTDTRNISTNAKCRVKIIYKKVVVHKKKTY